VYIARKDLGIGICIIGNIAAILFVPCQFLMLKEILLIDIFDKNIIIKEIQFL